MISLQDWAYRWGIPEAAMRELASVPGLEPVEPDRRRGGSEAGALAAVRLEAARAGIHAFRNNVGAMVDKTGRAVRFGLANDSKQLNAKLKSHDLIGWRSHVVTVDDIGKRHAIFWSREIKSPGWKYSGDEHEQAQLRWHSLVLAAGGDSAFATGIGTVK